MRVLAACALATLSFAAAASADPIDFESPDTPGNKSEPFTSSDSLIVHFFDTIGNDLVVGDFGAQSDGQALAVFGDDASMLGMDFDQNMAALSLDFGNDDPNFTSSGDLAILKAYNNGVFVGMTVVVLNRDDVMNQSITFGGPNFDQAFFYYGNASFQPINLIEVVDNVNYRVPEPSLLALSGLGALVVAWRRRRKIA